MRAMGVTEPVLTLAELGEGESAELVRHDVTLSCWLDNAGERLARTKTDTLQVMTRLSALLPRRVVAA